MAIKKTNFTVSPGRNTIVLRRCSPGVSLGSMRLTFAYGKSYSLGLLYDDGDAAAWITDFGKPGKPSLVDLGTLEGADPPPPVNLLTKLDVDALPGVPAQGTIPVWLGFNGSFNIAAGSPLIKPSVAHVQLDFPVRSAYFDNAIVNLGVSVWDIEIDKESPVGSTSVSGSTDPDDPLKTRYVIPIPTSSTPEWAPGGQPLAYKYKLGDFMEGIIRINLSGSGGTTPGPVCGTSVE